MNNTEEIFKNYAFFKEDRSEGEIDMTIKLSRALSSRNMQRLEQGQIRQNKGMSVKK